MTHTEFERFPFSIAGSDLSASNIIAHNHTFVQTKRIQRILVEDKEDEPPPPPTFSEEELELAKEEGYRKGFDDGEKKGLAFAQSEVAEIEQAALDQIPQIIEEMKSVFTLYNQFAAEQKQALPKLALALAKKICGDLPPEYLLEQVVTYTTECIETMLGEPALHIYVHPSLSDKVEARLASHFSNNHEPGDVLIHKDDQLPLSDCRVEWKSGGMEYTHGAVLAQLEELIAGVSHRPHSGHKQVDTDTASPETQPIVEGPQPATETTATEATQAEPEEVQAAIKEDLPLANADKDPELNEAVSEAINQQRALDDIPPIPEDPQAQPSEDTNTAGKAGPITSNVGEEKTDTDNTPPTTNNEN